MMDKEQMKMTGKPCEGLLMEDPVEAYKHIRINVVRDYGVCIRASFICLG